MIGEFNELYKIIAENDFEKRVEKRGDKWCVVHCTGPEKGKLIKCFDSEKEAQAMHTAIEASKNVKKDELIESDLISEENNCNVTDFEYVINFSKLENKEENNDRIIYGEASDGLIDHDGQIVDLPSLHKSFDEYMKNPIIRYMHGRDQKYSGAIGKVIPEYVANDGTVYRTEFNEKPRLVCKISNSKDVDDIWTKIEEGILKGLSVGGKIDKIEKEVHPTLGKIERIIVKRWAETSVVDLPCSKGAFFNVIKACIPKEEKLECEEKNKKEENKNMTEETNVNKNESENVPEVELDELSKMVEENILSKLQEAETARVAATKADVEGMIKEYFEDMGKKFEELKAKVEAQAAMLVSEKLSETLMQSEEMGELNKTVNELKNSPLYKGYVEDDNDLSKKEDNDEEIDDDSLLNKILSV